MITDCIPPAAIIYVSGEPDEIDLVKAPYILVTDGSIHKLLSYPIAHYFTDKIKVVGDLDSIEPEKLPKNISVISAPDQNYNDFQKCFYLIDPST